jgi:DNA (cytosine-5)-methyltransferase 1
MRRALTVGSLFAGIGGIELGLEWTGGFRTVWQVEIDDYARKVLTKHWPAVLRWRDVRTFPCVTTAVGFACYPASWYVDLIAFGFPCQDISNAGKQAGLTGKRSGLLFEALRVVGLLKPRFVFVENVAALLHRGMGVVVENLASLGYSVEWDCIPAAAIGAPHIRDRVFLLAHSRSKHGRTRWPQRLAGDGARDAKSSYAMLQDDPDAKCSGLEKRQILRENSTEKLPAAKRMGLTVNANGEHAGCLQGTEKESEGRWVPKLERRFIGPRGPWSVEPDVGRVADGISHRVDRLRCLGNAVVPQVAQWIGERILEAVEDEECEGR